MPALHKHFNDTRRAFLRSQARSIFFLALYVRNLPIGVNLETPTMTQKRGVSTHAGSHFLPQLKGLLPAHHGWLTTHEPLITLPQGPATRRDSAHFLLLSARVTNSVESR